MMQKWLVWFSISDWVNGPYFKILILLWRNLMPESQKTSTVRKPMKIWKLLDIFQWKFLQVIAKIDCAWKYKKGSWLSGGETEIYCIYFLYEAKFKKVHESSTWKKIEQCEKDLKFKKTTSIHFTQLNPAKAFT